MMHERADRNYAVTAASGATVPVTVPAPPVLRPQESERPARVANTKEGL